MHSDTGPDLSQMTIAELEEHVDEMRAATGHRRGEPAFVWCRIAGGVAEDDLWQQLGEESQATTGWEPA